MRRKKKGKKEEGVHDVPALLGWAQGWGGGGRDGGERRGEGEGDESEVICPVHKFMLIFHSLFYHHLHCSRPKLTSERFTGCPRA